MLQSKFVFWLLIITASVLAIQAMQEGKLIYAAFCMLVWLRLWEGGA